jgi:hypothetical protein
MKGFIFALFLISCSGCSVLEKQYNDTVWTSEEGMTTAELQKLFDEYNVKYFEGKLNCKVHWFKSETLNGQMCFLPWGKEIFIAYNIDKDRIRKTMLHEMCHANYTCITHGGHCRGFRDEVRRVAKLSGYPANEIFWRLDEFKDK